MCEFDPNPSHHCRATSLPSSHYTGASRANPTLGGGAPAYTSTAGEVLGAKASSDIVPTAFEGHPSRLPVASFPWSISTMVSLQNESPLVF
jgi:hypothetical protein